ncbi:VQ motif-containing protein 11-like [Apium graveolens]|uniref:VQ motif-containing protein 11-like n=1 Tax=Apium graveolens TaxID=4045 RepID=UPI003D7B38FC
MASGSSYPNKPNNKNKSPMNASSVQLDAGEKTTIYVNADPSNFKAVVQKLTGCNTDPTIQNFPITISPHPLNKNHGYVDVRRIRPSFNLQDPIQNTRNLHLQLNQNGLVLAESFSAPRKRMMDASPLSILDTFTGGSGGSTPRTPLSPSVQEEIAIANKEFYLHPRPFATSRMPEPKLLPLFPTSPNS